MDTRSDSPQLPPAWEGPQPEHPAVTAFRSRAVEALRRLAARSDRFPQERARLLASAWTFGERNVAALARAADVTRQTVYDDLRAQGIDPRGRDEPTAVPRHRPLDPDAVRQVADTAASVLSGAMLTAEPGPLAEAAWQAHIALGRVADLLDTPDDTERLSAVDDLAARGTFVRRHAHKLLAASYTDEQVARHVQDAQITAAETQPDIGEATLQVSFPDGTRTQIRIGAAGPPAGPMWTTWTASDGTPLRRPDAFEHLEVAAAFDTLAQALARALPDHVLYPTGDQ
jgi:hypothetical protein